MRLEEIRRLTPQPGDRLVVRLGSLRVTPQMAAEAAERIRVVLRLPDIPVLVIGAEDEVTVVGGDAS